MTKTECLSEDIARLMTERDALKAEVERLKGERIEKLEAERDELRFRLTKQQEAREAVEAERDQARAECERWRHDYNELSANHSQARAQVEELAHVEADLGGRVATLEAALRKYGRHRRDLPHPCMYPDGDCTCGLDAALAGGG